MRTCVDALAGGGADPEDADESEGALVERASFHRGTAAQAQSLGCVVVMRATIPPVYEDNQTFDTESFIALYRDARDRLTAPRATIAARYELCEDLANLLTDHCSTLLFRDGLDEATVLGRCHRGLLVAPTSVEPAEAEWVVRRTAELLGWPVDLALE